jgi:hypothetical protein
MQKISTLPIFPLPVRIFLLIIKNVINLNSKVHLHVIIYAHKFQKLCTLLVWTDRLPVKFVEEAHLLHVDVNILLFMPTVWYEANLDFVRDIFWVLKISLRIMNIHNYGLIKLMENQFELSNTL